MKNLKYAFHGLSYKMGITIVIFIQVIACMYFLSSSITKFIDLKEEKEKIIKVYGEKNPFRLVRKAEEVAISQENLNRDSMQKFNNYFLNNNKFESIVVENPGVYIKNFKKGEKFLEFYSESESKFIPKSYSKVKSIIVSNNFSKVFKLPMSEGRFFEEEDFKKSNFKETDYVPIVLGASYKGICKLGEEFNFVSEYGGDNTKGKVIGFIKDNTSCISITQYIDLVKYDDYIILPLMNHLSDVYSEDYILKMGAIFPKNSKEGDCIAKEIMEKVKEYNIGSFNYYDYNNYFNSIVNEAKSSIKSDFIMFFMIIVFCSIGIITSMLSSIRKRIPEFGVHMLCGAKMRDITIRIILEIGIIIMCAFVAISPISLIKYKNIASVAYLFIFSIVLIILLCIIPVIKLRKLNVNEIVRQL